MARRLLMPLIIGVVGTAVLIVLGTWQLERLRWKEAVIGRLEGRMAADPVTVPDDAKPERDGYLRVRTEGVIRPGELHVYTSVPPHGVGYRVIAPLDLRDGRRVLLDRGFVPIDEKEAARPVGPVEVAGALHWPQESDRFTAEPDRAANIWFARDVAPMAEVLEAEPVMLVVERSSLEGGPMPLPVTANVPNRHLEYVVTWYGLAAAWAGMTLYWLWRIAWRPGGMPGAAGGRP